MSIKDALKSIIFPNNKDRAAARALLAGMGLLSLIGIIVMMLVIANNSIHYTRLVSAAVAIASLAIILWMAFGPVRKE